MRYTHNSYQQPCKVDQARKKHQAPHSASCNCGVEVGFELETLQCSNNIG